MKYFTYCRKSSEDDKRQVPSIPSQVAEAERAVRGEQNIEIVQVLDEAQSAMWPGRPTFNEMLDRIERGDAQGIVAWAPNRLARNSVDAGRIVYLLDTGALKDIKFVTYTFQNTPEGKFMLQIMLSQSKYYSDALSVDVKRGQRRKLEDGWRPNGGAMGYQTDPDDRTIKPDPAYFPLVRQIFELALTGAYSAREIARIARNDWGMRSPKKRKVGGTPIGTSTVHRMLTNPFYAGRVIWNGHVHHGKHQPVVTTEEFQTVQRVLGRPGRERPQRHQFAFTGLLRCGSCGLRVTAEHKVNRYGSRYVYYHCGKSSGRARCPERAVQAGLLAEQFAKFLGSIELVREIEEFVFDELATDAKEQESVERAKTTSLEASLRAAEQEMRELTGLRTRQLIDDTEFAAERDRLRAEADALRETIARTGENNDPIEPLRELISFSELALVWFLAGEDSDRRLIIQTAASNPCLTAKTLSIQAAKPFVELGKFAERPSMRGGVHDVRTLDTATRSLLFKQITVITDALKTPECSHILPNIQMLRARFAVDATLRQAA